jgi:hypothetical protein
MRTLKLHFPDDALPTLDTFVKQTKGWCTCSLRVIPAVQNPVQCPFYHLCEGAVPWYPISFSTSSG